ncbi:SMP-30/gluconolactonase/LRE family protein [Nocardioides ultimimeridianus]
MTELGQILALAIRQDSIARIDLDTGAVETFLTDAGARPDGIVIRGGSAYWTTMGRPTFTPGEPPSEKTADYTHRNGGVHAIDLDGTHLRDVVPVGAITTGKQLATDGEWLYWSDREGSRVSKARLDGSGLTDLVVRDPAEGIDGQCVGIAVDAAHGHLYWTQKGPAKGGRGRIFRCGLSLPEGEDPSRRTDIETLWDGLPEPIDLELVDGWLYWTDRGAAPAGNTLNRAPVPAPGALGEAPEILVDGLREAIGLAVDTARGWAHVSDLGGTITSVRLEPGADGTREVRRVDAGAPTTGITLLA